MTRTAMPSPNNTNYEKLFMRRTPAMATDAGLDPRPGPAGGSFRGVGPQTGGFPRKRDNNELADRSRRRRARDEGESSGMGPDDVAEGRKILLGDGDDLADIVGELQGLFRKAIADPGDL